MLMPPVLVSALPLPHRLSVQQRRAEVQEGRRRHLPGQSGDKERQRHPAVRGNARVLLQQMDQLLENNVVKITNAEQQPYFDLGLITFFYVFESLPLKAVFHTLDFSYQLIFCIIYTRRTRTIHVYFILQYIFM